MFSLLNYFSRETKVLSIVYFLKLPILFCIIIINSKKINQLPLALAGPQVVFYQDLRTFWFTYFFVVSTKASVSAVL